MRLKSKSQLIEWLSGVQVVCLVLALVAFGWWIRTQVGSVIRHQIMAENKIVAEQIGRLLGTLHDGQLEYGDQNWDKFQTIVEETTLPNDGYLCIADATSGDILCHPKIRQQPALKSANLMGLEVMSPDKSSWNLFQKVKDEPISQIQALTGIAGKGDRTEVVSAALLPNINGILFVHQTEASTRASVLRILNPLGFAGLIIGALLIVTTAKLSTRIVKSFEHELATINTGLEQTVNDRTEALMKTRNAVIFGLAKLAESRDSDTGEHLDRISLFSSKLASVHAEVCPELDQTCVQSIGLASSLHDIGKVGVPDRVLLKPDRLTTEERKEIETHPRIGEDCLNAIEGQLEEDGFLSLAREICAFHHERWDGTGYPYGKRGRDIPISARIVAVADVYDALRSKRPYKDAMSHKQACRIIADGAGSHFDPDVVVSFIRVHREFDAISNDSLQAKNQSSIPIKKRCQVPFW